MSSSGAALGSFRTEFRFDSEPGSEHEYYNVSGGGFLAGDTQETGDSNLGINSDNALTSTGAERLYEGSRLYSLKINSILKNLRDSSHQQSLKLFDEEVTLFKLIGVVHELFVDEVSERWSFSLSDGTGVITVEWLAHRLRDYAELEPSQWMKDELARIQNNTYVRVCGDINLLGKDKPHVSAFIVSAIDVPEEILLHDLQVAHFISTKIASTRKIGLPITKDEKKFFESDDLTCQKLFFEPDPAPTRTAGETKFEEDKPHVPKSISLYKADNDGFFPSRSSAPTKADTELSSESRAAASTSALSSFFSEKADKFSAGQARNSNKLSDVGVTILEVIRNMNKLKPNGLSAEDLQSQLAGRGISMIN